MLEKIDNPTEDKLKSFLYFILIIFLMILILVGFVLLSNNSSSNKLKNQIEFVLENSRSEEYSKSLSIGRPVKINSAIAVSSNVFEVISVKDTLPRYALITRVTTYYGPQAAVFYYDENKEVSFEGFACLNNRVSNQVKINDYDLTLNYWKTKAAKIFENIDSTLDGEEIDE